MPNVHDFVPIDEGFEEAGSVLVSNGSAWLTEPAAAALAASDVAVEFGDARMIERSVVIPVRWVAGKGPFTTLDADLRLEPMPTQHSHLSLTGTYQASVNGHDVLTEQHLTESLVRSFLVGVAATLERGRTDQP
ncbi:MAG: hypothetical protein M3046_15080 [Actinomycetota bacterium]|nr:hypothetical protein [Actinomycetota bacterium]